MSNTTGSWQYLSVRVKGGDQELGEAIKKHVELGWELVDVFYVNVGQKLFTDSFVILLKCWESN
jgi:hypothetical protein